MKKKFSLWLNIATICLCICAIAIGVYAAQQATLTVSGSIGFEAHNVEYTATAKAKNYATDEEGDEFKSELTDVTKTQGTQVNNVLSLIDMYFSDKSGEVPDIELEITITNNSKFDITITPESASCTGVKITPPSVTSADKDESVKLTYTLSLQKNSSNEYDNIKANTLTISIKLERDKTSYKTNTKGNQIVVNKYTEQEQSAIWDATAGYANSNYSRSYVKGTDKSYAEQFPYYITMGKKSVTDSDTQETTTYDIKWLIVGTNNTGTVTALTTEDKAILEKGKLLEDTTYVVLSAEAIEQRAFHTTIEKTNNINANDYYQSDIRAYLNNTETIGFAAKYQLTGINIKKREVKELYKDMGGVSDGTINTKESVNGLDNFWILSYEEISTLLFKENGYVSASITTELGADESALTRAWCWLSRSPYSYYSASVSYVSNYYGCLCYDDGCIATDVCAVRPAFQF